MKVKDLLTSHHRWTRNTFARDNKGLTVDYSDKHAVRFCLLGGISRVYKTSKEIQAVKERVRSYLRFNVKMKHELSDIADFNDFSDFKAVKKLVEDLDI